MSSFGVAPARCIAMGCELEQAFERRHNIEGHLPLCFAHRAEFQRSPEYLSWWRSKQRDLTGAAAVALVGWIERLGAAS